MKRIVTGVFILFLVGLCTACGNNVLQNSKTDSENPQSDTQIEADEAASNEESEAQEIVEKKEFLIAYFSRTGNTKELAEEISSQTGGELFEIVPTEPYPADYDETVERFRRERDENARPTIANSVKDMAHYDVIFIGFPNWGDDMPHIVYTFLEQYDFTGKTIVPFCTNGGGGFGNSIEGLSRTCPNSKIFESFECSVNGLQSENGNIAEWLGSLGLEE